jgi:pimeloyl-ACP methyl ester carboxylesterase
MIENRIRISSTLFPQLSYIKVGEGPAMVLLHGFPENGNLWRNIWPQLQKEFTVIVPDIPGSGESRLATTSVTMEQLAEGVAQILDNESIEEVVVVGHSMGGYIALSFAHLYKSRLKGLSLVHSTATADSEEKKETRKKSIQLIQKGGKDTFIKQMIPALFSEAFKKQHPDILEDEIARGLKMESESMVAFYNAMINRPDRTATLNEVGVPIQWIIGKEDSLIPAENVLAQTRLADVNFVMVYADCGHMSMLEKPQKLTRDLEQFGKYCHGNKS